MGKYFITEFLNIECNDLGNLVVDFKIEGDDAGFYRRVESDDYYYWVMDNFIEDTFTFDDVVDDWDNEEDMDMPVTFGEWLLDQHGEESVMNFLESNFPLIEDLPDAIY